MGAGRISKIEGASAIENHSIDGHFINTLL